MSRLQVEIRGRDREYPIFVEGGLLTDIGGHLSQFELSPQAVVITDENVKRYSHPLIKGLEQAGFSPKLVVIPPGEDQKSIQRLSWSYDQVFAFSPDRRTPVVAFGGGVVGDLAGMVAATLLRGVPLVQVPTSLLAQVDSSVGGKVAVNHPTGKNLIGAFYQPEAVFIDPETLSSLPPREFRCGLAEVIKYGVIWDEGLFSLLEERISDLLALDAELTARVIAACCRIKAEVVGRDERESGLRMILNYGHTLGHALETLSRGELKHGEAVALGMAAAAETGVRLGALPESARERQNALLKRAGFSLEAPCIAESEILSLLKRDKKVYEGQLNFVLPEAVGRVRVEHGLDFALLLDAYRKLKEAER